MLTVGVLLPQSAFATKTAAAAAAATETTVTLDKKERKELKKELRKERKTIKEQLKKAADDSTTNTLILVILTIFIPPLAVGLHQGGLTNVFWLNLLLTLLLFLPGLIHALIVILGDK